MSFDPLTTVLVVQVPRQTVAYGCLERPDADALYELTGAEPAEHHGAEALCPDGSAAIPLQDTITHAILQPSLYANGGSAGLVMPLPRRADVNIGPQALIDQAQSLIRANVRETVEFVEDPSLGYQCSDPHYSVNTHPTNDGFNPLAAPLMLYGCSDGSSDYYRPGLDGRDTSVVSYGETGSVEFESIPISEEYEVTVLSASTLEALVTWLDERGFEHDEIDDAAFSRYVGEGRWFAAVQVTPALDGGVKQALPPLVVSWRGADFPITNEISYDPDGGIIETDLFVLAPQKMAVLGDSVVRFAAPFELGYADDAIGSFGLESGWLTRINLERNMSDALQMDSELVPAGDAVEVYVDWVERSTTVRIAQACCSGNAIPRGGARTFTEVWEYGPGDRPSDDDYFYRAPPPDGSACTYSSYGGSSGGGGSGSTSSSDEPSGSYLCTVTGAVGSWSPLVVALFFIARRRRRHLR